MGSSWLQAASACALLVPVRYEFSSPCWLATSAVCTGQAQTKALCCCPACMPLLQLVRRIDVTVRDVRWSDSGELVAILAESSFYILRYDSGAVEQAREEGTANEEDGIEEAFELLSEVTERVRTGEPLLTS